MRWVLIRDFLDCTLVLRLLPQLRLAHVKDEYPSDGIVHRLWLGPLFVKLRISISSRLA